MKQFHGIPYKLLRESRGIAALDETFLRWLASHYPEQVKLLQQFRSDSSSWGELQYEDWILDMAPVVADFLTAGLGIEKAVQAQSAIIIRDKQIFAFQSTVVKRTKHRAREITPPLFSSIDAWLSQRLQQAGYDLTDREGDIAAWAAELETQGDDALDDINQLELWCLAACHTDEGRDAVGYWSMFRMPERLDLSHLVHTEVAPNTNPSKMQSVAGVTRPRVGFDLTDHGLEQRHRLSEAHYCVYCHDKSGDFCTRGFPVKKNEPAQGYRTHPTGELLLGCPVDEKVSQMHKLYAQGNVIAALAAVMIENPLCALTGHRICNDCMKACIYQKQSPVNTPEVESGVLMDALHLPWGVELYDLLMRWNPMRKQQAIEAPYNGRNIMVMGLGPAGISACHHLMMEGCAVVAADGLTIKPLPDEWCQKPIEQIADIWEPLATRPIRGFGGVAEYGITVRWNKNFLTLIQLLYQRRPYLSIIGQVRFGGTITVPDVWELGFDHLCLALGAGLPRELPVPNSMAPGMRQANDFLMALQLTAAGRRRSLASLQLKLPVLVIGGGLTGVDAATEAQAYYVEQIEQVAGWYQLCMQRDRGAALQSKFSVAHWELLQIWLEHAKSWSSYVSECAANGEIPDVGSFVARYGGVTIVYRRHLEDSPAYKHNHEELEKALAEGVFYLPCATPIAVVCEQTGAVAGLRCEMRAPDGQGGWGEVEEVVELPAGSILSATGASPNIAYEFEHRGTFVKRNGAYWPHGWGGDHLIQDESETGHCKTKPASMLTSYNDGKHRISLLGDAHPWFHGSVVQAVASAKVAYPQILATITDEQNHDRDFHQYRVEIEDKLSASLLDVRNVGSGIVEWVVRAPWLAKKHKPGQFYRVELLEQVAGWTGEAVALLGALDPSKPDCLLFWVMANSPSAARLMQANSGQRIAVMGPTGAWTKIPADDEHLVVIGGAMAAAYVRSVGPAWRAHGHRVSWIGLFANSSEVIERSELLDGVDDYLVITDSDDGGTIAADTVAQGALEEVVVEWMSAGLGIDWQQLTAVHTIGSADLLRTVQNARHGSWCEFLPKDLYWVGSTYGPMQCMLKGVCAQCLQWQLDPNTGERTKAVYACSWQHQPMDIIDIEHLGLRAEQIATHQQLADIAFMSA